MIKMTQTRFLGGLFVVGLCLVAGNVAVSQVPSINAKGKYKEPKQFVASVNAAMDAQVYNVPAGRTLVITDLFINNLDSSAAFSQRVIRDGDTANAINITVPATSTFSHSFGQGLVFPEGSLLEVRNGGSAVTVFSLTGYEYK